MPLSPVASLAGDWLRTSRVALPGSLTSWTLTSAASWARTWFTAAGVARADGEPLAAAPGLGAGVEVTTRATTTAAAAARATTPKPAVRRGSQWLHRRRPGGGSRPARAAPP